MVTKLQFLSDCFCDVIDEIRTHFRPDKFSENLDSFPVSETSNEDETRRANVQTLVQTQHRITVLQALLVNSDNLIRQFYQQMLSQLFKKARQFDYQKVMCNIRKLA
jgi:hypothetical protein